MPELVYSYNHKHLFHTCFPDWFKFEKEGQKQRKNYK